MKKLSLLIIAAFASVTLSSAKEGMWLPLLLKSLNENDMQTMGLKLSADDIYSINQSSLKDAVVSFGGFCTGEIISDQGLILTNHHCGYGQVQSHSSVENDYLTNGYWAMNHDAELKNPDLTATFIVRMEDVTQQVLEGISDKLVETKRQKLIQSRIDSIVKLTTAETEYEAFIKPFFYGNEYYMFVTETFKDIRLVGAPPSAIGKFGGDTDNWIWPRHTGDFSLFRIYANKENKPAEYSEDNVPYRPKHYFPISMTGVDKGDFTMVYGFPGRTQEYLTSYAIRQIKEVINPSRIAIREEALTIMDGHMKEDAKVRIQYASKYASISNYWKKWIGENRGLQKSGAIQLKEAKETAFLKATKGKKEYEGLLSAFEERYKKIEDYALGRSYFLEIPYRKMEMVRLASRFSPLVNKTMKGKKLTKEDLETIKTQIEAHFKDFDLSTDVDVSVRLAKMYEEGMGKEFTPEILLSSKMSQEAALRKAMNNSLFAKKKNVISLLDGFNKGKAKKIMKDPVFVMMTQFWSVYFDKVRPEYNRLSAEIDSLSKIYVKGLRENVPGVYYPDANSTLRLAYGQVDSYEPRDAVSYNFFTDSDGILEKYDPNNVDFDLPERLIDLIKKKDFGQYADKDGSLHVCFTASNHTTGGNSGSPVLNAKGELIGLNFDRNWEGTMSDINYDIQQCRNISVDIRYVLFVIDKYAGAGHLVKEMNLIHKK